MHTDDNDYNDIYSEVNLDEENYDNEIKNIKKNNHHSNGDVVDNFVDNNEEDFDQDFYGYDAFINNPEANEEKPNKSKKIIIIIAIVLVLLLLIGVLVFFLFIKDDNEQPVLTPGITLSQTDFELAVGSSEKLTYTIQNYTENILVTWSSSNKSVATVDKDGIVKGIKEGTVTISAKYVIDEVEYEETCLVNVKKNVSNVPTLSLSKTKLELTIDSSQKLTYTVKNNNGNISVTWSSSNKSIATVDKNGVVKGIKEGNATITATYTVDGKKYTKTCSVIVKKKVETIPTVTLSKTKLSLTIGTSEKLTYTVKNNSSNISVTWSSSNKSIATVDKNGVVSGIKEGTATITATYSYNGKKYTKTCSVTVGKDTGGVDKIAPLLSYTITSGKENTWVNTNVSIKVSVVDNSGAANLKYAKNCSSNCSYNILSGDTITISNAGTTSVTIVATDASYNSTTKKVTVMIDKSDPSCSLSVLESGDIQASYWDSGGSGIASYSFANGSTSLKVSSAGTYSYTVKDKAGNTGSCSISVKTKTQYRYKTCAVLNNSGGCSTWSSQYSAWSDTKVTSTGTRKVETRTVFYS